MFAISIWHAKLTNVALGHKMLALTWMGFGIITVMPVVTAMGLLYWMNTPSVKFLAESKALL
jgi:hypothetical protein